MLDRDLAELYGVEVKQLNRQVKRNIERFPSDFMFQLTKEDCIRCQIGTLYERGGKTLNWSTYRPLAFTENGIAMLSGVLVGNAELHNLGSSVNCLGRRLTTYTTRDRKEIAKLLSLVP